MEKRFCGQCGRPVAECTCGAKNAEIKTTDFSAVRIDQEAGNVSGSYFVERFDNLALAHGETVVRQYHIGKFAKGLRGKGNSSILVTNKRVISKSDTRYLFTSSNMVEEIALGEVAGVKTYFAQGITIWRLLVLISAILAAIVGLLGAINESIELLSITVVAGLIAFWMIKTLRKPSYLFSIYSSATSPAMVMGANLRGKLMNAGGNGIVFQYKPTKEAVTMMCEMGACIMDLKSRGNAAIETWKNQ